jgi:hypothetical protein
MLEEEKRSLIENNKRNAKKSPAPFPASSLPINNIQNSKSGGESSKTIP